MESLEGLEYVHRLTDVNGVRMNVVHRDFSPSNIYLSVKGEVKLGDFGIAQIESSRFRPIDFIAKGKFGYMAPEQVEGRGVDRRADVYSAGVVLSELLIGRKLFSGNSRLSVMLNIRDGRMEALESNSERISPGVMEIIRGALAKRPSERYGTAAEFRDRLGEYLVREGREVSLDEIGRLVRQAVVLREPRSSAPHFVRDATPITETQTVTVVNLEPEVTCRHGGLERAEQNDGTPVTAENETLRSDGRYLAHMQDGLTIGPTSYAHIIELIYSDRINHDTEISIDGHRFVRASDLPELARHLPAFTPTCDVDEVTTPPDRRGYLEMETRPRC